MRQVDTTIVDLHRAGKKALEVVEVQGTAWRVADATIGDPIRAGDSLGVGDTVYVDAGGVVVLDGDRLEGGLRGAAHSFVPEDAFRSPPTLADVPKLVSQLEQLEKQVKEQRGEDPLSEQSGPITHFDRAMARDFAIQNLTYEVAVELPETIARNERSVCLFVHGDAVCVAMTQMSVRRIRTLMSVLGRPINPHLVDEETIQALLAMVYSRSVSS